MSWESSTNHDVVQKIKLVTGRPIKTERREVPDGFVFQSMLDGTRIRSEIPDFKPRNLAKGIRAYFEEILKSSSQH